MEPTTPSHQPDCPQCFALCCTAFGFTRSADFAIDKPPATPCPNLAADFSCAIHRSLRARGFAGCTAFDCFGAGQAVSQRLFHGISWREDPQSAKGMFAAFRVLRQLHEMLWQLDRAESMAYSPETAREVSQVRSLVRETAGGSLETVLAADVEVLHGKVGAALREVSEEVRAGFFDPDPRVARLAPDADLAGADLRGWRLCGADLRGACLIAADLRGTDLKAVDLLGADLRDARLDDADLAGALFLTQAQVTAARGSASTLLPPGLERPGHWQAAAARTAEVP
jgi:hypothetical protein